MDKTREVMQQRSKETKKTMLSTAAVIFAKHGYKGTTVRRLCKQCKVNISAISYYFNSKDHLYIEVFRYLFHSQGARYNFDKELNITNNEEWLEELTCITRYLLSIMAGKTRLNQCRSRLLLWERTNPSTMLPEIMKEFLNPIFRHYEKLIRMALPKETKDETVNLWRTSIIGQLAIYAPFNSDWSKLLIAKIDNHEKWLDETTVHILQGISCRLKFISQE